MSISPMLTIECNPYLMRINTIFLSIIFLIMGLNLKAQEFYGGVLAGFNGSQVEGDLASGYNKLGLEAGVWAQRDFSDKFYWGAELKLNQKGSRIMPTKRNGYRKYVYRLNYVDLPVWIGYQVLPDISVFGGLSYGYVFHKNGMDNYGVDPTVLYSDVSNWELGMFIGFKVDFERIVEQRWARDFMLETRFQYSALSIDSGHDLFFNYFSLGQFNNVISTVLYYKIDWSRSRN